MKTLKLSAVVMVITLASSANAQYYPGATYPGAGYPGGQQNPYAAQAQYLMNPQSGIASQVQQASCIGGSCGVGCSDGGCGMLGGGACGGGGAGCGLLGGGCGGHCCGKHGPNGTGACCAPRWFDVQADWLFWNRDFGDSLALASDGRLGPIALSTDDLEIKDESGVRVTGAYLIAPATALEVSYFGGFNWASSAVATSDANELFSVFSEFGTNPFNGFNQTDFASEHSVAFSSALDNGELNLRHRWVSANCIFHCSTMAGVRYFRLAEDMIHSTTAANGSMDYVLKTDNDLVGAQIGSDFAICVTPRFKIGGDIDAGVYGTHSKQRTDVNWTSINVGSVTEGSLAELESASDVAFVGEAGLHTLFQVTPRLNLRAGYQVLFVTGVATAVDNFNTESPFSSRNAYINNDGKVFYHGANLGFEFTW